MRLFEITSGYRKEVKDKKLMKYVLYEAVDEARKMSRPSLITGMETEGIESVPYLIHMEGRSYCFDQSSMNYVREMLNLVRKQQIDAVFFRNYKEGLKRLGGGVKHD